MKDNNNLANMAEFVSPDGTRRDARFVVRQVAMALGIALDNLETDADCKAWADDVSATDLQQGLAEFGTLLCKALALCPTGAAQMARNQAIGRTIARTFVRIGAVSVKHASNRKSPFEPGKFEPDCFTTAEHCGTFAALGWTLKGAGKTILTPDVGTNTLSDTVHDMPPMVPTGDSPSLPVGASRNGRGDVSYTPAGALQAAQYYAAVAVEADRKIRPEAQRNMALQARLVRVINKAKALRTALAQARADLDKARADLDKARMAPIATKRATKATK